MNFSIKFGFIYNGKVKNNHILNTTICSMHEVKTNYIIPKSRLLAMFGKQLDPPSKVPKEKLKMAVTYYTLLYV